MERETFRSIGRLLTFASVFLLLSACGGSSPPISGKQTPLLGTEIDALVLKYLEDNEIPGATVAVTKNGRLVLWKGYGWADRENQEAMKPWHRTRIGSVSKVVTAIGVLQLVESGDISLDQPVYSSQIEVIWPRAGSSDEPWLLSNPDGALNNIGIYLDALVEAPERLLNSKEELDVNSLPQYLDQGGSQANVEKMLEWASQIRVWHVLSHTAGYLRSGNTKVARDYWNLGANVPLSYAQLHAAMLAGTYVYTTSEGKQFRAVPLRFKAGLNRRYSNHGFGVLGLLISERSGQSYHDYIQDNVFAPLGLSNLVDAYTFTNLDATSYFYDEKKDQTQRKMPPAPTIDSMLGLATGGWAANAHDMARILCALDTRNDVLGQPYVAESRLLDSETIKSMVENEFGRVLGWDKVEDRVTYDYVTKDGSIPRVPGGARVSKYFYPDLTNIDTEINVAILFNVNKVPAEKLLNNIARIVKKTSIPEDYDLFDPNYRCVSGVQFMTGG